MRRGAFWVYANSKAPDQPVTLIKDFGIYMYSITSMARTRMARLPWMIRILFSVPTKFFQ